MFPSRKTFLASLLLFGLAAGFAAAAQEEVREITGRITAIENNKITVQNDRETVTVAIEDLTVRGAQPLQTGQNVRVTYYTTDALVAKEIQVQPN